MGAQVAVTGAKGEENGDISSVHSDDQGQGDELPREHHHYGRVSHVNADSGDKKPVQAVD